jgi:hypothetical protein
MDMLKISDGDLIVIAHSGDNYTHASALRTAIEAWLSRRGLAETKVTTGNINTAPGVRIDVFTVNDIFQTSVLDK